MTATATMNVIGAAAGEASSGTRVNWSNTIGITLTEISMMTVPVTVVVNNLRSSRSREESRNWNSDETMTSLARSMGPPWLRAAMLTAMNAPEVPMSRMKPAPIRHRRTACRIVVTPLTKMAANTAQARYSSLPPAARTMIAGVITIPATQRVAYCRPIVAARRVGGRPSTS